MFATFLELVGVVCLCVGAYFLFPVAALFVAGTYLLLIAQADPALKLPRVSRKKTKDG